MEKNMSSILSMDMLCFDKIEFIRLGMKNDEAEFGFGLRLEIGKKADGELYKVTLTLDGKKENEYSLEIALTGYFSFATSEELDNSTREHLIQKNTVTIMMPYLRSQLSLLTAQPEVEPIVLPPFNIAKMLSKD